jgi:CDP-diacylglycerol--serine O-phosphatidyltransferase
LAGHTGYRGFNRGFFLGTPPQMGDESATSEFEQRDSGQRVEGESEAFAGLSESPTQSPIILSFVIDRANLVSLLGLASGVLAIYFALRQNFPAAIIALLWAVLMDWFDGLVARRAVGRSEAHKLVGARMDSLVDLVTSAVAPAILLLSVGNFNLWFYPGALAIIMAGVLRLAYFDAFGVDENGTYAGITIDNSPLVVSGVFLLQGFLNHNVFAAVLYSTIVVLAFLHVAPFRTGKVGIGWYYVVTAYVVILTAIYSYILWTT